MKRFGDNLRTARRRAGLTQEALAHLMGYKGNSQIARWERDDRPPKPESVQRLAVALQCDPSVLMDGVSLGYDAFRSHDDDDPEARVHDAPRPDDDEDRAN